MGPSSLFQQHFEGLKSYLELKLPEYMLPQHYIYLDQLPLTLNGKLDHLSLLRADSPMIETMLEYIAPKDYIDQILQNIWSKVLGVNKIGITDNFFKLGGNSIKVIYMINLINTYFNCNLRVIDAFKCNSISLLREHIKKFINLGRVDNGEILRQLNNSQRNKNIFMIHPSKAGCEVYFELANKLEQEFNCYGIDNYNLHNDCKFESLVELANHYRMRLAKRD